MKLPYDPVFRNGIVERWTVYLNSPVIARSAVIITIFENISLEKIIVAMELDSAPVSPFKLTIPDCAIMACKLDHPAKGMMGIGGTCGRVSYKPQALERDVVGRKRKPAATAVDAR